MSIWNKLWCCCVIFNLGPSLVEPIYGTLLVLMKKKKRDNGKHDITFEASDQRQCMSLYITLSTQVICHSARWVLDLSNPPNSPIRKKHLQFHGQAWYPSEKKCNVTRAEKWIFWIKNVPHGVRTLPFATVFKCDFKYAALHFTTDSRAANYKALNIDEKC